MTVTNDLFLCLKKINKKFIALAVRLTSKKINFILNSMYFFLLLEKIFM
jgi:hypothetical protein